MKRWLGRSEGALFAMVLGAYADFYQAGGWALFGPPRTSRGEATSAVGHGMEHPLTLSYELG